LEQDYPNHLHFRSSDLQNEDLFTVDTRNPSLLHLHQTARSDWNDIMKGSQTYSKSNRPKSLDPSLLIEDGRRSFGDQVMIEIAPSAALNDLFNPRGFLPTPDEKTLKDCSQKIGEVITVDVSGSQYDRKVSYRKSQRYSCSGGVNGVKRRKNQQKFRDRHQTVLPTSVCNKLGFEEIRPASSDFTSNSNVESSFGSEDLSPSNQSCKSREALIQATNKPLNHNVHESAKLASIMKFPFSPFRRNTKHRNTISVTDIKRPDIKNDKSDNKSAVKSTEPREDRSSSGFWSESESARHSGNSDTINHRNNSTSIKKINSKDTNSIYQQNLIQKDYFEKNPLRTSEIRSPSLSASSTSINSRLSTFDTKSDVSSVFHESLGGAGPSSKHDDVTDSCDRLEVKTPLGAYRFMEGDEPDSQPILQHELDSPIDPIIIDDESHNGYSSLFRPRKKGTKEDDENSGGNYYGTSTFGKSSSSLVRVPSIPVDHLDQQKIADDLRKRHEEVIQKQKARLDPKKSFTDEDFEERQRKLDQLHHRQQQELQKRQMEEKKKLMLIHAQKDLEEEINKETSTESNYQKYIANTELLAKNQVGNTESRPAPPRRSSSLNRCNDSVCKKDSSSQPNGSSTSLSSLSPISSTPSPTFVDGDFSDSSTNNQQIHKSSMNHEKDENLKSLEDDSKIKSKFGENEKKSINRTNSFLKSVDEKQTDANSSKPNPLIKQKPAVLPKPKHLQPTSPEVKHVVNKTAIARANFFGISSPTPSTNSSFSSSSFDSKSSPTSPIQRIKKDAAQEPRPGRIDDVYNHVINTLQNEKVKDKPFPINETNHVTSTPNIKEQEQKGSPDQIKESPVIKTKPILQDSFDKSADLSSSYSKNLKEFSDDRSDISDNSSSILSGISSSSVRLRPKVVPLKDEDSRSTSRLKQSRYSTSSINGFKSPINKSPNSTLEKRRYSGTSLERRRKNGITSTNDFKALLLQNTTSRSPSSHHMTAAEKLRLTSPTVNKTRSPNNEEMMTTNRRVGGDYNSPGRSYIMPGVLRTGRYSSRHGNQHEGRWSYGGGPLQLSKNHPPLSHSGRYTAIRSRTPTRVMNSISEDVAEYERCPDNPIMARSYIQLTVRSETDV